jgi:GntR family transcriptional regulator
MFALDFQSRQPIYEQLYWSVARMAALGVLEKDETLPSVRVLAQELGVNPNTVQKAYALLEHDGIICTVPGKGSLISGNASALEKQKRLAADRLRTAVHDAEEMGLVREEIKAVVSGCFGKGGEQK